MLNYEVNISVLANSVGYGFAHSSSREQSSLINSLGRELFVACKGKADFESQVCHISNELDSNGVRFIQELSEFIKLREETAPKE